MVWFHVWKKYNKLMAINKNMYVKNQEKSMMNLLKKYIIHPLRLKYYLIK